MFMDLDKHYGAKLDLTISNYCLSKLAFLSFFLDLVVEFKAFAVATWVDQV